jgi:hypothetical protein
MLMVTGFLFVGLSGEAGLPAPRKTQREPKRNRSECLACGESAAAAHDDLTMIELTNEFEQTVVAGREPLDGPPST